MKKMILIVICLTQNLYSVNLREKSVFSASYPSHTCGATNCGGRKGLECTYIAKQSIKIHREEINNIIEEINNSVRHNTVPDKDLIRKLICHTWHLHEALGDDSYYCHELFLLVENIQRPISDYFFSIDATKGCGINEKYPTLLNVHWIEILKIYNTLIRDHFKRHLVTLPAIDTLRIACIA